MFFTVSRTPYISHHTAVEHKLFCLYKKNVILDYEEKIIKQIFDI